MTAKHPFVSLSLWVSCLIIHPCFEGPRNIQSVMHLRSLSGSRGSTCGKDKLLVEFFAPAVVPLFHTTQTPSEAEHREVRFRIKIHTWRQHSLWLPFVCVHILVGHRHFTCRVESDSTDGNNYAPHTWNWIFSHLLAAGRVAMQET